MTLLAALAICALTSAAQEPPFSEDIAAFEAVDAAQAPPRDPVLFVGSSSIGHWDTLAQDFPGVPVLNRGFGGARISDCVRYASRIVIPYRPREIVFYAGDNDLDEGASPRQVLADFEAFVAKVDAALPGTPMVFVSIKPSPERAALLASVRETNALVRGFAQAHGIEYVDVFTPMLDDQGQPRAELFGDDGLHMNARGYAIWAKLIAPKIDPRRRLRADHGGLVGPNAALLSR